MLFFKIKHHPSLGRLGQGLFYILSLLILVACSGLNDSAPEPLQTMSDEGRGEIVPTNLTQQEGTEDIPSHQRLVIKTANLTLIVSDPAETIAMITSLVEDSGGWVVASFLTRFTNELDESLMRGRITVRVPADQLNHLLSLIKAQALEIQSEEVSGQDVTSEFVDLQSQLRNLRAAEEQVQIFMNNAENTNAVLTIYNELSRIRGEIEQLEGRSNYLSESAAYSTISLIIEPPTVPADQVHSREWNLGETVENAWQDLLDILQALVKMLIYFVIVYLPFLILPLAILAWWWWRKKRPKL